MTTAQAGFASWRQTKSIPSVGIIAPKPSLPHALSGMEEKDKKENVGSFILSAFHVHCREFKSLQLGFRNRTLDRAATKQKLSH